jgi:hypothetical protein
VRFAQYGQFQRWALEQAAKGALPTLDQLPNIATSFKGYTLTNGALTWGGQPIGGTVQSPVVKFISGLYWGKS